VRPPPGVRDSQRVPGPRDSQRLVTGAAGAFRCPRCAVMVVPGADGHCPKCGSPPPHLVAMPLPTTPTPVTSPDARGVNWLGLAAVVLAGVIGSAVGVRWSRTACDQNRGHSVAGETRIDRLGVKVFFPAGWRQHKSADQVQAIMPGATAKGLGYYRGGTSDSPTVGLMLMVTDDLPLPADARATISDAQLKPVLDSATDGLVKSGIQMAPGEIVQLGLRSTGRSTGEGSIDNEVRRVAVYVWMMGRKVGVAVFFADLPLDKLLAEADDIVGGIEPLAAAEH
jgi:hypothetical protein